ncbi:hypothetical protein GQ457_06G009150 [Hibiscus cannabinus]
MYVLLELVIDTSKCECLNVSKIKDWKKYWKILIWSKLSKLSKGAKESLLENKASLEVSESVRLNIAAFDEIASTRCWR